jgi:ferredoxin
MSGKPIVFACSCEDTMKLDGIALRRCGGEVRTSDQLCRARLDAFRAALAEGRPITVGCTQEAPLFEEVAEEAGFAAGLAFANVRESAGWSDAGSQAGPKMAALLAGAAEILPEPRLVALQSTGVTLIYGRDEAAIAAAKWLAATLDVTVLLTQPGDVLPPSVDDFPVLKGTIVKARGHLGAFELTVDDYARPSPASRARLMFGVARDGAVSRCDIVVDLSGGAPLFPAHTLRPGYVRADPGRPETVERALADAAALVGTFDKPRFVELSESLCAHQRNMRVGCTRCLDLCPTGAIAPAGDYVSVDAAVCAGCGACAAACPTGAITYAMPPSTVLLPRLRAMFLTYRDAGGEDAVVLVHDAAHGTEMIETAARLGRGLPANVLPFAVNEVTQTGLDFIAATFAWGAAGVRFLLRAKPLHDVTGLQRTIAVAEAMLSGLGFAPDAVTALETDDPDALWDITATGHGVAEPSHFVPMGEGRHLTTMAVKALHGVAPTQGGPIALPAGAAFGGLRIDTEGCTLCLACVGVCPTNSLRDDPDRPMLRFAEEACVQCGLCRATCPEKVIALEPRLDIASWGEPPVVVKQEEPFCCITCGKPFGTTSSVERVVAKLKEKHWMFTGAGAHRLDALRMCEDCRVEAMVNESFDPHGAPPPPRMS